VIRIVWMLKEDRPASMPMASTLKADPPVRLSRVLNQIQRRRMQRHRDCQLDAIAQRRVVCCRIAPDRLKLLFNVLDPREDGTKIRVGTSAP
jgi:hypothetical protein